MAIKSKNEILEEVRGLTGDGETPSEATISLLEDIEDSFIEGEINTEDYVERKKYDEDIANWKKRYTERFGQQNDSSANRVRDEPGSNHFNDSSDQKKNEPTVSLFKNGGEMRNNGIYSL